MPIPYATPPNIIGNYVYNWPTLNNGDDGQPAGIAGSGDRTVQVQGTFGAGGTVVIQGSLDGQTWYTLRDPIGNLLSFTGAGLKAVLENTLQIRPLVTAGDSTTAIQVLISVRRENNG